MSLDTDGRVHNHACFVMFEKVLVLQTFSKRRSIFVKNHWFFHK